MEILITKKEVAAMLRVNPRTITRWQNRDVDPLPVAKTKPLSQYDIASAFDWAVLQRLSKLSVSDDGSAYDYLVERARLTHEQADKVTLENAHLRGELIPREEVEATWSEIISLLRGRILGLPTKLAPAIHACGDVGETCAILTDGLHEALQEIETNGLPPEAEARINLVAESAEKD